MFFILLTILFFSLWLFLWIVSYFIINPYNGYIDNQLTLSPNESDTNQEEMPVFTIESQF